MNNRKIALLLVLSIIALFAASTILAWRGPLPTWGDETFTLRLARDNWPDFWREIRLDVHPPLYFALSKIGADMWSGNSMAPPGVRTVAYLIYLLSIGIPLVLLYRRMSRQAFFFAAILIVTSAHLALFGPMLRYYALSSLGVTSATLLLIPEKNERAPHARAVWYGIALLVAFWSSYLTAIIIPAHIFYLNKKARSEVKSFWTAMGIAVLLSIPLLFLLYAQIGMQKGGSTILRIFPIIKGFIARLLFSIYSFSLGEFLQPWHIGTMIAIIAVVWLIISAWKLRKSDLGRLLWTSFLVGTIFGMLMLTILGIGIEFTASRLMFLAMPLLILIGAAAGEEMSGSIRGRITLLAFAMVVSFNVISTWNFHQGKDYIQSTYVIPWSKIADDVSSKLSDKAVLLYDDDTLPYWLPENPHIGLSQNVNTISDGFNRQEFVGDNYLRQLGNPSTILIVYSPRMPRRTLFCREFCKVSINLTAPKLKSICPRMKPAYGGNRCY